MTQTQRPAQTQQRQAQQAPWDGRNQAQPPATTEQANGQKAQGGEREIEYIPLGESTKIKLTVNMVRQFLCVPTKLGHMPSDADVVKYMMVCRQRNLNPWVGDCFLLGYDTKHGPKFSIVVAIQALLKRADIHPQMDGLESGVVVRRDDSSEIVERPGDLVFDGETLVGGWALCFRKDRSRPFYQRLKLSTYRRQTQQWDNDAAGMIVKCAEAGSLRQAFPSDIGGLYLEQELYEAAGGSGRHVEPKPQSSAAQLKERMAGSVVGTAPPPAAEATQERQEAPREHDQDDASMGREPGDDEGEPNPAAEAAETAPQPVTFGGK